MNGIKCIRERCNLSMSELADRIGVTRQTISLWEKGVRTPSPARKAALCKFFGLPEHFLGEIHEKDLEVVDSMKIYRHKTETSEFYTFAPFRDEEPEPYLTLKNLKGWNDARYAETVQRFKKLMDIIEESAHEDNDEALLADRISKMARVCTSLEKYMEVLSLIEKTKAERGTYLKVPMRFEIWSVLDSMMLGLGLYTAEEIYQKFPYEFESEFVHVDKDYMQELADRIREHWNKKVHFFTECRYGRKSDQ